MLKLTAPRIKSAGPGRYNDGQGLWFAKRPDGGAQYVLRLSVFGRRADRNPSGGRLLILTGSRSLLVRAARLDQIEGDVWTIPAQLMKGTKGKTHDFRIPLSQEALNVVDLARPFSRNGLLFADPSVGMISDATMSRLMERRGLSRRLQDIGNHGFALFQ